MIELAVYNVAGSAAEYFYIKNNLCQCEYTRLAAFHLTNNIKDELYLESIKNKK